MKKNSVAFAAPLLVGDEPTNKAAIKQCYFLTSRTIWGFNFESAITRLGQLNDGRLDCSCKT